MAYHGSARCHGCSGEDCVCCEVYLEERACQRVADESPLDDYEDAWEDDDFNGKCPECGGQLDDGLCDGCGYAVKGKAIDMPNEDMDGDFDGGMTSAGLGTNEDYGDYGYSDCDF